MFEHFTEHAQRVLELEGMEVQRMHHDYLGTEHLLLALVDEPEGHGHRALVNLGLSKRQVHEAVGSLVAEGPAAEMPPEVHQTPRFKHVMQLAVEQSRQLNHGHIGTEHLLLALLGEPQGVAMKALQALGLTAEQVREEVLGMLENERLTRPQD